MTEENTQSQTKGGRPLKNEEPRVDYNEVDRLLVIGEMGLADENAEPIMSYPSYRELAKRYGVAHSIIADYARKHDCMRRREKARMRLLAKTEEKLLEMRAQAIAFSKDDATETIDAFLLGFREAIDARRVRVDNPSDFNTMLRLKEFISGGADSRQEIHAGLSLEDLQARHREMLKTLETTSDAECGVVERETKSLPTANLSDRATPPAFSSGAGDGKPTAHQVDGEHSAPQFVPEQTGSAAPSAADNDADYDEDEP